VNFGTAAAQGICDSMNRCAAEAAGVPIAHIHKKKPGEEGGSRRAWRSCRKTIAEGVADSPYQTHMTAACRKARNLSEPTPLAFAAKHSLHVRGTLCSDGKSTPLKIAAGLVEADFGTGFLQPGATIRYCLEFQIRSVPCEAERIRTYSSGFIGKKCRDCVQGVDRS
jgi:hypothetical protein